ncbi:hypothetical protein P255_02804 [Acinetobacter brisouii CIP 110357]|uniref:Uncharacterized protein n=1 Tax=Acinetobacter brisouii CIP 110357 TaxID=1341683 RepID=V2UK98_9GAMM|nr:hypothetical protein F954_00062 [Acinetobacter brisouii ANC 4119]ESK49065.1 hypothetical protein P255_02804 [Acinetobacter brisouii CIP 110357]
MEHIKIIRSVRRNLGQERTHLVALYHANSLISFLLPDIYLLIEKTYVKL